MKSRGLFVILVGGISILFPLAAARGGRSYCVGQFGFTAFDHVVVPAGNTCKLDNFNLVRGHIKVEEGATLIICPDNAVDGDIDAKGAETVFISDQHVSLCEEAPGPKALGIVVGGNITIKKTQSFTLIGNPSGVTSVSGNVSVKDSGSVSIFSFDGIEGNVDIKNNGDVDISSNTIDGHLRIRGTTGNCVEANNSIGGHLDPCP